MGEWRSVLNSHQEAVELVVRLPTCYYAIWLSVSAKHPCRPRSRTYDADVGDGDTRSVEADDVGVLQGHHDLRS